MNNKKMLFASLTVIMLFAASANPSTSVGEPSPEPEAQPTAEQRLQASMDTFVLVKQQVKSKIISNHKNE